MGTRKCIRNLRAESNYSIKRHFAERDVVSQSLTIDDSFLVAKRIALGPLLDMSAAFLDALETHYELFLEEPSGEPDSRGRMSVRTEFGKRDRMPLN